MLITPFYGRIMDIHFKIVYLQIVRLKPLLNDKTHQK